jgi:hypothetical protein
MNFILILALIRTTHGSAPVDFRCIFHDHLADANRLSICRAASPDAKPPGSLPAVAPVVLHEMRPVRMTDAHKTASPLNRVLEFVSVRRS